MEYDEETADKLGRLNEFKNFSFGTKEIPSENMDLWNNAVGRRYGLKYKEKNSLQEALRDALESGEIIILPSDVRKYEGATHFKLDENKPVIVLDESNSGRNEVFYDIAQKKTLNRSEFILAIRQGHYLGYFGYVRISQREIA